MGKENALARERLAYKYFLIKNNISYKTRESTKSLRAKVRKGRE